MPTKRIGELPGPQLCRDRDHDVPTHQAFDPGEYEHECPTCHRKLRFTVHPIRIEIHNVRRPWGMTRKGAIDEVTTNPQSAIGYGRGDDFHKTPCGTCAGSGYTHEIRPGEPGQDVSCATCGGHGVIA